MIFFDHSILYRTVIAKGAHFKLSDVNDLKDGNYFRDNAIFASMIAMTSRVAQRHDNAIRYH